MLIESSQRLAVTFDVLGIPQPQGFAYWDFNVNFIGDYKSV